MDIGHFLHLLINAKSQSAVSVALWL